MVRIPTHRSPTHPGEMLLEEFLALMGLTQCELADAIHVPYRRVNDIVRGFLDDCTIMLGNVICSKNEIVDYHS